MHILLRPVPDLSVTLERRPAAAFFFTAAKCTNINSAISTPGTADHHRQQMAPSGMRKNTLPTLGPGRHTCREDPRQGQRRRLAGPDVPQPSPEQGLGR
jgi:hypothetical protein